MFSRPTSDRASSGIAISADLTPRTIWRVLVCLLVFAALCVPTLTFAQSQASTGQITGTVKDAAGALITGAAVKVTNINTGYEQTATSTDAGLYTALLLPPGQYKVVASHAGFADSIANVEVGVGRAIVVNFSLAVSGRKEELTVTAEAIEVTRHESSAFVNSTLVSQLPLNGGRFHDIALMTPTVQIDSSRGGLNISGQRAINGSAIVDGTSYDNPFFGGLRGGERAGQTPTMPLSAIQEFQVVRAGYNAEFGRSTGGIITAVTKSGSNGFHGDGNYYVRPQSIAGDNPFYGAVRNSLAVPFAVVPAPTLMQWGGSFGGPIKKDRLFFFGAYTQQRFRQDRTILFNDIPTFTPDATTREAYNYYLSQQQPFKQTNDAKVGLGKVDYVISNNHRLSVKYNRSVNEALNSVTAGTSPNPVTSAALSNNGNELDDTHTITGNLVSFFHGLTNELRGEYSRETRPRPANAQQPLVSSRFGSYGTVSFLGQNIEKDWRLQFADSITWQKGKHTFKFGGEYNHLYATQTFGFNQFGAFSPSTPTNSVASVLQLMSANGTLGTGNRYDNTNTTYQHQIGNLQASLPGDLPAFFIQDSWRIHPRLTINAGLRWEGEKNPQPVATNPDLINLVNGFVWPLSAGGIIPRTEDPTFIPNAWKQFSPRLGFAWDPAGNGKTVIRGFGGIYYAASPLLLFAGPFNNFRATPGDMSVQLPLDVSALPKTGPCTPGSPSTYGNCNTVYKQFSLIGVNLNQFAVGSEPALTNDQLLNIGRALGYNNLTTLGTQPLMMDNHFENPRSYQAGFGFEREVMNGWTVTVDADWIKTVHLERNMELDLPIPTINALSGRPQYGLTAGVPRPIKTLNSFSARVSNAKALYRALTIGTRYNASKRLQLTAYYTLSENLADDDQERNAGGISYSDASSRTFFSREYYFSAQDRHHQFVASPVFFAPWGIELASSMRFVSGQPLYNTGSSAFPDISINSDTSGNQDRVSTNDRPFSAVGVMFPRYAFRQPGVKSMDFRVQKTVKITESKNIVASMDFFNAFNWMNLQYGGSELNYCGTFTSFGTTSGSNATATCGFAGPTNPVFQQFRDVTANGVAHGSPYLTTSNPGPVRQIQFAFKFIF